MKSLKTRIRKKKAIVRIEEMLLGYDANKAHSVPKENGPWYSLRENHEYWNAYFSLSEKKLRQWSKNEEEALESLQSLEFNTTKIVNHLFNPELQGQQSRYGLVIGHVQSGKTANYTGVIAKAADSGYNLIIVLTGLYNDLRHQTQVRLEKELTGTIQDQKGNSVDSRDYKKPWRILTRTGAKGDFFNGYPKSKANYHPSLSMEDIDQPTILLMKKNVTPLTHLNEWIASTNPSVIEKLNVLIIDDVLSAGTAGRESIEAILKVSATPSSFIVGLDRQERGLSEISASKELEKDFNIKVESIVNLDSLIDFVKENGVYTDHLDRLNEYRENWGA